MVLDFDPSADFAEVADGTVTVTLYRRGSTPGSPGTVIANALCQGLTTRQSRARNRNDTWKRIASDGRYTAGDVVWHLPTEELNVAPQLGDVLVDDEGRRWTVLEVQLTTLRSRWRCLSRNLAIAYGLDDTVTILRATFSKGEGGAAEPTWRPWRTGLRARIQPAEAVITGEHQTRQVAARYRNVALDHTHCIRGPDGTIYKIKAVNAAERIGELQTIEAEVTPWPAA
jgi:hypothetical protein